MPLQLKKCGLYRLKNTQLLLVCLLGIVATAIISVKPLSEIFYIYRVPYIVGEIYEFRSFYASKVIIRISPISQTKSYYLHKFLN